MKHVFYLHSNICTLVCYDMISDLINEGNEIIVITGRNCNYPYFRGKITVLDLSERFKGYTNHLGSVFQAKTYTELRSFRKYIKELTAELFVFVKSDDFFLYTPNYNTPASRILASMNNCIGYYFLEEGAMSYLGIKQIKSYSYKWTTLVGNVVRRCLGVKTYFQLHISRKYKGTIALSPNAFPWNHSNKIIASLEHYKEHISDNYKSYQAIAVVSYGAHSVREIIDALRIAYQHEKTIHGDNINMAVKLHPQLLYYRPSEAKELLMCIQKEIKEIDILPSTYVIEDALILNASTIYSIIDLSSLSLYSISINNSLSYLVASNLTADKLCVIKTVEEYFSIINRLS